MRDILYEIFDIIGSLFKEEEVWILLLLLVFALGLSGVVFVAPSLDGSITGNEILSLVWYMLRIMLPFFLLVFLTALVKGLWMFWRQSIHKSKWEYAMFEIVVPREIKKGASAMEQILKSLHMLRNAPRTYRAKYIEGEVTKYFAIEIVSDGGQIHIYVRVPQKAKKFIEAAFYSYYSDLEIREVNDYAATLPQTVQSVYEQDKNVWGMEAILAKDDMFPIRSYKDFESSAEDEKKFDPISVLFEVLGKIKPGEFVGVQLVLTPKDDKWSAIWKDKLKELRAKTGKDVAEMESAIQAHAVKSVEANLSKPAFDTTIRFLYLARNEIFNDGYVSSGLMGSFNQYSSGNLNAFKKGWDTGTNVWSWPHVYKTRRNEFRKQRILYNYIFRVVADQNPCAKLMTSHVHNWNIYSKQVTLSTESVATIFHPPTNIVLVSPHMKRAESKSVGPTAGLDIFGDENEIQEFIKQ